MKKTLIGALFLSAGTLPAQAQISAGTKLLSTSLHYSYQTTEEVLNSLNSKQGKLVYEEFGFVPSAGYFVTENLAVGLTGQLSVRKRHFGTAASGPGTITGVYLEQKIRTLSGGVFGRYYKFLGEKVALYGQLGVNYQNNYYYFSSRYDSSNGRGLYAYLSPGLVFFPSNKIGLELAMRGASYDRMTNERDVINSSATKNTVTTSTFNFGFGLNDLNLGISFYLGRN
ncbi:outer membrane beta-barrel protein [Hymenobacter psychrophilus]|uniref:Outer membrane protein beta-barrel domain-containing protein n=1 Tax=Hymenobacter psychrophilus TaxID=651662 RepID=A0A1H3IKT2_9BACT|nr:outer membrane beta-barrel protein [Hymenobacter psychrophilus]SDY28386.1 Outer membrane protein beta-barrel domain-containing protein [Hymenobacter psychrophilus]